MRAPLSAGSADMLLMRCGFPPTPTGRRNRRAVIMDGVAYPSIKAAAGFAATSETGLSEALRRGRTRALGHDIRYAEEEA